MMVLRLSFPATLFNYGLILTNLTSLLQITEAFSAGKGMYMGATPPSSFQDTKYTLYDLPVSNNSARCRIIIAKKNIQNVALAPPSDLGGGLHSEAFLQCNPQGKFPLLTQDGDAQSAFSLPESDTIARFLLQQQPQAGPSFQPDNVLSNLMVRLHDMYLTTIQGCLYKASPPFGAFSTRRLAIEETVRQWQILDDLIEVGETADDKNDDVYLCGTEVSLADATLFPSAVFAVYILPKFGVASPLPPKLARWYNRIVQCDPDFAIVQEEILSGLRQWEERNRWNGILGAGWKDEAPPTLFDKLLSGEIPADIVEQPDSEVLAFRDINPAAPAHVLVIPKQRDGLTRLQEATAEHTEILGRLLIAAAAISKDESLGFGDGARIVINDGPNGGQEVMHLHLHVLGGRPMSWPPG